MGYGMTYTQEMKDFILDNYKGISAQELANRLNTRFGISVTSGMMKSYKGNHKLNSGLTGHFVEGQEARNKGMKMPKEIYEKAKGTMFKKGHMPHNHRPVGSERVSKDGYIEVKVAEPKKWRLKHNLVWEGRNGKIPRNHVVIMLDGDKLNVSIDNLKLIKRSELLIMNRYNLYGADAETTRTATNLAGLIDATNKAKKGAHQAK